MAGSSTADTAAPSTASPSNGSLDDRVVFFFDVDNTLYSASYGVAQLMGEKIQSYFARNLHLPAAEAQKLHAYYYRHYGLALRGLVRHHKVDAMAYNAEVDEALPLDSLLKPNPRLREFLLRIDRSKCRLWVFTNAYVSHARRVLRLLGLEGVFEGVTYCDYADPDMTCKPYGESYDAAMRDAGLDPRNDAHRDRCYFVDDSKSNVDGAVHARWKHVLYYDEGHCGSTGGSQGVGAPASNSSTDAASTTGDQAGGASAAGSSTGESAAAGKQQPLSRHGLHESSGPAPHRPPHSRMQLRPGDLSPQVRAVADGSLKPVPEVSDSISDSTAISSTVPTSTRAPIASATGAVADADAEAPKKGDSQRGFATIDDLRKIETAFPELFLASPQAPLEQNYV